MAKHLGFSLLEIVVALSLAAIIAAFAIPSFTNLFERAAQKILSEQLFRAINLSREEAISLGETVTLCQSENQNTCSGEWSSGYIVLSNDHVLFSFTNKKNQGELHWRAFPIYLDHLEFLSSGSSNFQNGTFWYCPKSAENPAWAIMLIQSGRARLVYPDKSGVIVDDQGEKIGC